MALKFANGAISTLAGNVGIGDVVLSVQAADAAKFPALGAGDWFPCTIKDAGGNKETVKVTARAGAVLTITRAQEGTTAKAFATGARIELRVTAAVLRALQDMSDLPDVDVTRTNLGINNTNNTSDADKPISTAQAAKNLELENDLDAAVTSLGGEIDAATAEMMLRVPVGFMATWPMPTPPPNWFERDGALLSRATYPALWGALKKDGTVTVTIANPAVVTWTAHGRQAGDKVRFYTTGALPTGLTANTDYFVLSTGMTADTFRVSATQGGAAIATTGAQNGVHTCRYAPHGHGDGLTTFPLPDDRGIHERYWDHGRGTADSGRVFASEQMDDIKSHPHTLVMDAVLPHTHTYGPVTGAYGANGQSYAEFRPSMGDSDRSQATITTSANGGHTPTGVVQNAGIAENRVRTRAYLPIIKYN